MKDILAQFIAREILNDEERQIGEDDDLLTGGLVDSMGIMALVFFVEQEFGLEVAPGDVTIENFGSIRAIEAYLTQHTA